MRQCPAGWPRCLSRRAEIDTGYAQPCGMTGSGDVVPSDHEAGGRGHGTRRGGGRCVHRGGGGSAVGPGAGVRGPPRAELRGRAGAPDPRAVRDRRRRQRQGRRGRGRLGALRAPVRPGRPARLGGPAARHHLHPRRPGAGDRRGPDAGRGRLVLADRGARRAHLRLRGAQRDGDPRRDRGVWRQTRRAAGDRFRAAGLLVAGGSGRPVRGPSRPGRRGRAGAGGAGRASCRLVRGDLRRGRAAPAGGGGDGAPPARPAARPMREGTVPAGSPAQRQQEAKQEQEAGQQHPEAVPLLEPRDGLPPLVTTAPALAEAVTALGAGEGPVAVDAERASGYRYGHRAFLVQLRRRGAGTVLIDPIACPDLSALDAALAGGEAVLHAASQDLPCLAELGYQPRQLFDTGLAGRLLGYPRVGLGVLVETVLGFTLEKAHAAADWSTRPLPTEWLRYAALDVEVLVELRDALAAELV